MCTAKQRVPEEKSQTLAAISAVMFFNISFAFLWELGRTTGRREADFWALRLSGRIRDLMLIHDASKLEDP